MSTEEHNNSNSDSPEQSKTKVDDEVIVLRTASAGTGTGTEHEDTYVDTEEFEQKPSQQTEEEEQFGSWNATTSEENGRAEVIDRTPKKNSFKLQISFDISGSGRGGEIFTDEEKVRLRKQSASTRSSKTPRGLGSVGSVGSGSEREYPKSPRDLRRGYPSLIAEKKHYGTPNSLSKSKKRGSSSTPHGAQSPSTDRRARSFQRTNSFFLKQVDSESWFIPFEKLKIGALIGQGAFGNVYKGDFLGTEVALKNIVSMTKDLRTEFENEVSLLKTLRHPNIVMFMGMSSNESSLYIVTEYMNAGSLESILLDEKQQLNWTYRVKIAHEVGQGISYMHSKNVLHRDLKSGNILVDDRGRVKISDFGLSKYKKPTHYKKHKRKGSKVGTVWFRAPEIENLVYDHRVDIFSFGLVMAEMITRKPGEDIREQMTTAVRLPDGGGYEFKTDPSKLFGIFPRDCPSAFSELAVECCSVNPEERPKMEEVVERLRLLYDQLTHLESEMAFNLPSLESHNIWRAAITEESFGLVQIVRVKVVVEHLKFFLEQQICRKLNQDHINFLTTIINTYASHDCTINLTQFAQFWEFFNPVLKTIRLPKIFDLWKAGLVEGFLLKETTNKLLRQHRQPNTLIIRFCQTNPGSFKFAISRQMTSTEEEKKLGSLSSQSSPNINSPHYTDKNKSNNEDTNEIQQQRQQQQPSQPPPPPPPPQQQPPQTSSQLLKSHPHSLSDGSLAFMTTKKEDNQVVTEPDVQSPTGSFIENKSPDASKEGSEIESKDDLSASSAEEVNFPNEEKAKEICDILASSSTATTIETTTTTSSSSTTDTNTNDNTTTTTTTKTESTIITTTTTSTTSPGSTNEESIVVEEHLVRVEKTGFLDPNFIFFDSLYEMVRKCFPEVVSIYPTLSIELLRNAQQPPKIIIRRKVSL